MAEQHIASRVRRKFEAYSYYVLLLCMLTLYGAVCAWWYAYLDIAPSSLVAPYTILVTYIA
eukprot:3161831-Rhodomonas_salina.6